MISSISISIYFLKISILLVIWQPIIMTKNLKSFSINTSSRTQVEKKKRISFWSIILTSVPLKYFLPHSELKFLELAEPLLIQITFKHRMTLLFHEWLTHWEFRVLVICFAFFFFRNVNPAIPKISKFSSAKEFKFPPVAHLDKKIKVSGTSSQLVCPLIYTPVYKLARMLISQDLQVGRKLYR